MTFKRIFAPATACLVMAGLSAALPASAAEWATWKGQDEASPLAIYTDGADETGAFLVCDGQGQMRALLSLEPASLPDLLARNSAYSRTTEVSVQVGDAAATEAMFRYIPAIKSIETKSHNVAAKVFNSAVLGEPLTLVTKREGTVESQLPAPNGTFKAFAKTCKALRGESGN
ncbi:MAG TPA: hypothetical protein PK417_02025 [Hyphomonas sp.]|nr:hypothetical protein [Hyphomonas sp.]HRX73747.1 hypothetical protein [Hyphomonas sp.]